MPVDRGECSPALRLPDADGGVLAAAGNQPAVAAQGHSPNANGVAPTDNDYADFETAEMLADESFDRAFTSFMGNDMGAEPSRDWMINGE